MSKILIKREDKDSVVSAMAATGLSYPGLTATYGGGYVAEAEGAVLDAALSAGAVATAMAREEQLDNIKSFLGEGFHTAFRRTTNSHQAIVVWEAIQKCPGEDWDAVLEFVAGPLLDAWPSLTGQEQAEQTESSADPGQTDVALRVVFTEWLDGQLLKISEHGGASDYVPLVPRAREVASLLGLTWTDSLIPDYVQEIIASTT